MARTGFFDSSQGIYLPKDSLTWDDLNTSPYATWDNWTNWYQNLSSSTTVEFTTDIIDFGAAATVLPLASVFTGRDGGTGNVFLTDNSPTITIEGSNVSDLSSGVSSITLTRTDDPIYSSIGRFRYYRFTFTINSGINTAPQGFTGFNINLDTSGLEEVIEEFDTSTVDDGSSTTRVIPTRNTYSAITYAGITPTTTITDDEETVSGGLYVADGFVVSGYVDSDASTAVSITTLPLARFVSSTTNSITVSLVKPNTGDDTNATIDVLIKGLGGCAIDVEGNLVKT